MKNLILILIIGLLAQFKAFAQTDEMPSIAELQKWSHLEKEETRAKHDDQVLIVIVKVKEDSKEDFDLWIKDVLYDALYKSESMMKKAQLKATRWLEPTKQNEDGTWTYSWIMDPMIPGTNYDIIPFLTSEYGEKEGMKHWATYLTFMAGPPQSIIVTQTDF